MRKFFRHRAQLIAFLCVYVVYLFNRGRFTARRVLLCDAPGLEAAENSMKSLRHNAIRELVAGSQVGNQDEMRQLLRLRGIEVTQATLSRDIHELRLSKGPGGYSLPSTGAGSSSEDDRAPALTEMMESFGLRVRRAMNQVLIRTVMGGAQPFAAALDHEGWNDVVGTLAGDDTVLVICADPERACEVESRLRTMLES
jgi:transcriptional regulator of arginine metabolism